MGSPKLMRVNQISGESLPLWFPERAARFWTGFRATEGLVIDRGGL
ncbi:hypothetical protein RSK20926_10014 [Roseobacter sp. SK209-2-6]|nr:hypothetical protein RSK20926_10014 [Roseobacter sp. SK209-2-6]